MKYVMITLSRAPSGVIIWPGVSQQPTSTSVVSLQLVFVGFCLQIFLDLFSI